MYIIVEEEEPELATMQIDNRCEHYGFVYQQAGNTSRADVDVCDAMTSQAFTWTNPEGKRELLVQIYENNFKFKDGSNQKLKPEIDRKLYDHLVVSMDELNKRTEKIRIVKQL
jgi:hypothetical protein